MFRYALIIIVLVLSVSVTGQVPWQPPRTPDGQPDMQGFWQIAAATPGGPAFAPTLSLEGDHSRWQWDITVRGFAVPQQQSNIIDPPDGKIPYQPWAAAKRREFIANMLAPTKREHIDSHAFGLEGVPRINHAPPPNMQVVQASGYVVLLYEMNHQYRVIPLDGRPHVGTNIKLWTGDSRGRWEGNTLVVDVTNQNARSWLDWLSFHGEGLHVVERWTLVSPDRIDYRATLDDPMMFTQPWTIAYWFTRNKEEGFELWESAWHEGINDIDRLLRGGIGR